MNTSDRIERMMGAAGSDRPDCREVMRAELEAVANEEREAIIKQCRFLQEGTRGGFAEEILDELISVINARNSKQEKL